VSRLATFLLLALLLMPGMLAGCNLNPLQKSSPEDEQDGQGDVAASLTDTPLPTDTPSPTNTPLPTDTPTSTSTPTPTSTPMPTLRDLAIVEQGVTQIGTTVVYAFVMHNPSTTVSLHDAMYQIDLYDSTDTLVQSDEVTISLQLPDQFLGMAKQIELDQTAEISRMEVMPTSGSFNKADANEPLPLFTTESVGFLDSSLTTAIGMVNNPYPQEITNVQVSAIAYNEQEEIVGGGNMLVPSIPANDQLLVEIPLTIASRPNGGVTLYPMISETSRLGGQDLPQSGAVAPDQSSEQVEADDAQDMSPSATNGQAITATTETDSPTATLTGEPPAPAASPQQTATATPTETVEEPVEEEEGETAETQQATPTPTHTNVPDEEDTATVGEEDTPTATPTIAATGTPTPTLTPTPTIPMPTGDCASRAPDDPPDGPDAWLTRDDLEVGSQGRVCVWLVEDGQPVEDAEVRVNMLYLDLNTPHSVEVGTVTTDETGIADVLFDVPDTYEVELEITITHDDTTYDWKNYPEALGLFFTTE
jgi:hypothetical protein